MPIYQSLLFAFKKLSKFDLLFFVFSLLLFLFFTLFFFVHFFFWGSTVILKIIDYLDQEEAFSIKLVPSKT